MKALFLDESGDHNLTAIDPTYPVFVLGGVIVDHEYADGELTDRVRQFKRDLFGRDDIIPHTGDLARNRNGFERMKEPDFRQRVYDGLNELMRTLEYKVVACVWEVRSIEDRDWWCYPYPNSKARTRYAVPGL